MGALIESSVIAFIILGISFMLCRAALNLKRGNEWVKTSAVVCADQRDLNVPAFRQRPYSLTVLFDSLNGPVIAPIRLIGGDEPGLPIGDTVDIVYNPKDPYQVEIAADGSSLLGIIMMTTILLLSVFGAWRFFAGTH